MVRLWYVSHASVSALFFSAAIRPRFQIELKTSPQSHNEKNLEDTGI
jgi:hypothetical protein